MPFKVTEPCRSTNRASKVRGSVFNDNGQSWEHATRVHRNAKRNTLELEGILEVQKMLLLRLAEQENRVKGFSNQDVNERVKRVSSRVDLERLRVDTGLAIQATWSNGQNRHNNLGKE